MNKAGVIKQIREIGIIPVVRATTTEEAMRAIDAIREGGISVLEITMTVPNAFSVIEQVTARFGSDALVGAGTVLDAEDAKSCIASGAQFIVSPALNLDTIAFCREQDVTVMPGALTPTEVVQAWNAGADFVKIFPAGAVGGPSYLKALKAPLPQIELVPTGGVSLKTAADFIKAGAAALGVGTDLVDVKAQSSLITKRAKQYVEIVRHARDGL
ncbi:MAG TPA: bifunctional 4-hydroxy-2-oxoglutarate aldolase/2-dehydro-3-deoxy-phosphogluconate aldolase [Pyrinomonadaceae bacterium]|jgi:2-dehydro-3-deoxyphosphogluconate aldolase/(4S)-4-hydroxy-2-oxoglutarate aldolase|nr:bifunctional 4-hydroxy-2-oxoglutarate aldolase/2-dehydro-3-deoxy-phosphogluconate aldolase [Pyrinomonadaceae bacterium]